MSSDVMVAVVEEHNTVNNGSVEMDVLSVYSGTSSSHAEWRSTSLWSDVTSWWDLCVDTDPDAGICDGILPLEDKGRKWLWSALEDVCTLPRALLASVLNLYDRKTEKECVEFNETVQDDFH